MNKAKSCSYMKVAVNIPIFQTFTYEVPENLYDLVTPGKRVLVPFQHRKVTGYVLGPGNAKGIQSMKRILDVLDDDPLFPVSMIPFFQWISDYYIYPIGLAIQDALPGGLNLMDYLWISITGTGKKILNDDGKQERLTDVQRQILELLIEAPGQGATFQHLKKQLDRQVPLAVVHSMERQGWVRSERRLRGPTARPKMQRFASLNPDVLPDTLAELRPDQQEIVRLLQTRAEWATSELNRHIPNATRKLGPLMKKGIVQIQEKRVYRDPFGDPVPPDSPWPLTPDQQRVYDTVNRQLGKGFETFLLSGVTGSGKTEVYLQLAADVLRKGQQIIVLVPEIALISQMVRRFRARFGENVAVLHSGLSAGQRHDQWMRIIQGEAAIAIGARSAVFAPFDRVGLMIVDEEHDASYKQETRLLYNARDLAVVRARFHNAVALLGSATPSVQSSYNVQISRYRELRMDHRVEKRALPKITIVDLKKIRECRGMDKYISVQLRSAIRQTLDRNEQVLLFLNRRGYAGFPVCASCGEGLSCPHCDISMTLHQSVNAYKCHYCGFMLPATIPCPICKSPAIRHLGIGTEKLESAIHQMFPNARVARMDRDTTRRKGSLVRILKALKDQQIDILIGTQMVAKGHDFPHITLVGIVCADISMNIPDFRAGERTFQVLAQVAGRAGRGNSPGQVILQTYSPAHFAISAARQQNFRTFYETEIEFRKALQYPPFTRMVQLRLSSRDREKVQWFAQAMGDLCRTLIQHHQLFPHPPQILGPIEAPFGRIADQYRWQILVKHEHSSVLHRFITTLQNESPKLFQSREVRVVVDVDPYMVT